MPMRSRMKTSSFAVPKGKGKNKKKNNYPVDTLGRARNAITRVQQHGTSEEKRLVYSKIRRKYPALAKRSRIIPTKTGTGRHYGQAKGATNTKKRKR